MSEMIKIPLMPECPKVTGNAYVYFINRAEAWALVEAPDASWDEFNKAPRELVIADHVFTLRGKSHDGFNYATRQDTHRIEETMQKTVGTWTRSVFTEATQQSVPVRALEECVELCLAAGLSLNDVITAFGRVVVKSAEKNLNPDAKEHPLWHKIAEEAADVAICLYDLMELGGRNLEKETLEKLEINKKRKWGPTDEHNQRNHIKDGV